jgi:hypothetical protein
MLWPIVLVFVFLWLMGVALDVPRAYVLLVVAAVLAVSNLLLDRKQAL